MIRSRYSIKWVAFFYYASSQSLYGEWSATSAESVDERAKESKLASLRVSSGTHIIRLNNDTSRDDVIISCVAHYVQPSLEKGAMRRDP